MSASTTISYERIDSTTQILDKIVTSYVIRLSNQLQKLNFVLLEVSAIVIASNPAKKVVYTTSPSYAQDELRSMEIMIVNEDRLYTITCGVRSHEFSYYMPKVEKMLDSFVIHTQESEAFTLKSANSDVTVRAPRIPYNRVAELSVQLDLARKNIDRSDKQTLSISVADKNSHIPVRAATIKGEVFSPSTKFIPLEEQFTDHDGKVLYSWSVDTNAETGEFTVVTRISANGYEPKSVSDTYKVNPKSRAPAEVT